MMKRSALFCLVICSGFVLAGSTNARSGAHQEASLSGSGQKSYATSPPETHAFSVDASISIGIEFYGALVGDLRGDGVNRVVAGAWDTHHAYVFRREVGTYVEEWNQLYGSGDVVVPAAIGDVDNDGQNEFLISVRGTGALYMYRWNGTTYQKVHEQYFGGNYQPAAICDIDRDGANELIVDGNGTGTWIGVFDYDPIGSTFVLAWAAPKGNALQIAVGDPDGDGQIEAVVPLPWDYPPGKMMIIGYNGSTYSVEETIVSFLSSLGGAAVADFDGDGKEEIIAGLYNVGSATYPVYLVKYDGIQYNVTILCDAGYGTYQVRAGDIDRDGFPEAVIGRNFLSPLLVEFRNNAYSSVSVGLTGGGRIDLVDMDGDSRLEIIACPTYAQILSDTAGRSYLAADLDGDAKEELVSDLATEGLWRWSQAASWGMMTAIEPEGFTIADVDGNPTAEVAGDFGSSGLWLWREGVWSELTGLNPQAVIAGHLDGSGHEALITDFGKLGLWIYQDGSWTQMTGENVREMIAADFDGDGVDELAGDFGSLGLWLLNGGGWTLLSALDANLLARANIDGLGAQELIASFSVAGLWQWAGGMWTQLSGVSAEGVVSVNVDAVAGEEVIADFGSLGVWMLAGGVWTQKSGQNPDCLLVSDLNDDGLGDIAGDFGASGLWVLLSGASWLQLSALNADILAEADIDGDTFGEMAADFGSKGVWIYNHGAWTQIK